MDDPSCIQPPRALARILAATEQSGFGMASERRTGAFLRSLAAAKPGGRFLELGTGTGIATAWILDGMDAGSTLISVDNDPVPQAIARKALAIDPRLHLVIEDGIDFLGRQKPQSFDLVFADAMPGKYDGLDGALALVKPGGFYMIDDMLPQSNWPEGHAEKVQPLIDRLAGDTRFSVVPMAWASGLVVAVRKAS